MTKHNMPVLGVSPSSSFFQITKQQLNGENGIENTYLLFVGLFYYVALVSGVRIG